MTNFWIFLKLYKICQDNGPAREDLNARKLQDAGSVIGDPFEISTMRREDLAFHRGKINTHLVGNLKAVSLQSRWFHEVLFFLAKSAGDDLLQCNNAPSSRTPRGHQTPGAFLLLAAGLDKVRPLFSPTIVTNSIAWQYFLYFLNFAEWPYCSAAHQILPFGYCCLCWRSATWTYRRTYCSSGCAFHSKPAVKLNGWINFKAFIFPVFTVKSYLKKIIL